MKREPFPLQWPEGWPRVAEAARRRSYFGPKNSGQVSFSFAYQELRDELSRLGAVNAVVTTDLPTNSAGIPYATDRRSGDVGCAVWFLMPDASGKLQERVNACDQYRSCAENMYAIARTLDAIRGIARWGAADLITRAFAGFTALPPGASDASPAATQKRPWREVIGGAWPELEPAELLAIAKARHRKLIAEHHPDRGGDHAMAAELNAAIAEAEHALRAEGVFDVGRVGSIVFATTEEREAFFDRTARR